MNQSDTSSPAANEYLPSESVRARQQVADYEASDGAKGGDLNGKPVVILTTTGAISGAIRKTPIMKVTEGDAYVAIASYAGSPRNPAWYYNLVAEPRATIRDGSETISVRAREIQGDLKQELWTSVDAINPAYAQYRATSGRDIPILLLEPSAETTT